MERWDREPEDALGGGRVSESGSGPRVPLSASFLCARLDGLVSSSDAAAVVLLGSVSGKWWHTASEDRDCVGFRASKEGGEVV